MVKPFVALPDERIRQKSQEVTAYDRSLKELVRDLIETSKVQENPPALGMAAPQIGVFKKVFVAKIRNKFRPFVNPKITKVSKQQGAYLEGCFSVSGKYGSAIRPLEVDIEAQDVFGKKFTKHYKGLPARIVQHETEHLDGILFIDHVYKQNGKMFRVAKDKKGKEMLVEETVDSVITSAAK
ncbi:peptide deformylase [Candidatus Curtissbacteria bacterium RIFCSPHIGHO2_01_FULL_41_11]|uniref:Peptide deformylase n=1 Tax=Candidatus Curtissbacteria bacterium RIFCSPHIGHO2_01_FULL_41_11 TaxID=1797711 RepID=A0A1F5G5M4_9BACT|nr:MAG: peptide deformylase [Candidatus Curtissbacteria bacterium RIFCSPHIGHO2_01_FULL_41_11]